MTKHKAMSNLHFKGWFFLLSSVLVEYGMSVGKPSRGATMSGSTFRYEFVILDLSLRRYIEDVVESDSFKNAFFSVLMKNKKLCDKYLQIAALDRPFRGCAHVVSPVSLHLPGDCAPVFAYLFGNRCEAKSFFDTVLDDETVLIGQIGSLHFLHSPSLTCCGCV